MLVRQLSPSTTGRALVDLTYMPVARGTRTVTNLVANRPNTPSPRIESRLHGLHSAILHRRRRLRGRQHTDIRISHGRQTAHVGSPISSATRQRRRHPRRWDAYIRRGTTHTHSKHQGPRVYNGPNPTITQPTLPNLTLSLLLRRSHRELVIYHNK